MSWVTCALCGASTPIEIPEGTVVLTATCGQCWGDEENDDG